MREALLHAAFSRIPVFVFLLALASVGANMLHAQPGECLAGGCVTNVAYGAAQSTTSTTFVPSVPVTWAGEFNTYNVTAGEQYEWSLCPLDGATNPTFDTQLTLTTVANVPLCYSDDVCGLQAKIGWTATFTGQVRVHITQFNCAGNTNSHTVAWRCVSCGCVDNQIIVELFDSWGDGWNGATYSIVNSSGTTVASGGLPNGSFDSQTHCIPDGCYTMVLTAGSFPGEISWTLNTGVSTISGGAPGSFPFGIGGPAGCTNPLSANYDPNALCDDGSCLDCYNALPTGCPSIDAGEDVAMPECTTPCTPITLEAEFFEAGATTSYEVCSIDFNPPYAFNTGTPIFVNQDDIYSGVVNLPFNFCFYGNTYSQLVVGANGVISFNAAYANQFCPWAFNQNVPNANLPLNAIFGAYHDMDPSICGSVRYGVLGVAPCRVFVVNFDQVCHFSCTNLRTTQQIVLYETTNAIEVYIDSKPTCPGWNSGNAVIGIQNANGTQGITPDSRQTGSWSANNEAWRFTPNGPSIVEVNWYAQGPVLLGTGSTMEVCPTETSESFVAEAVYSRCDGTQITVADIVTVTCAVVLLPVEWLDFQARLINDERATLCTWSTGSETNNAYFTVERSADGLEWEPLGDVPGAGNSSVERNYQFTDQQPLFGRSYYRIRQTDFNGAFKFSDIRSVERKQAQPFAVAPNPGRDRFTLTGYQDGDLVIYDAQGRRIAFTLQLNGELNLHAAAPGVYFLELQKPYGVLPERLRLIVQ